MEELFSSIFDWISALNPMWTYVVIFAIAYGENIVPPIPGDMVIVFGGYLASSSGIDFFVIWGLATLGGILGFMTMYGFGYSIGDVIYEPDRYRWLPKQKMKRAQTWILRWGYGVVIANRFLAGTRTVISLVVGIAQMGMWKTAAACSFSAFLWTGLITYGGYAIGENWERMADYLQVYGSVILTATIVVVGVLLFAFWIRKKREK